MKTLIAKSRRRLSPVFNRVRESMLNDLPGYVKHQDHPLPGEMKLVEQYNCSRVTVRSVLTSLEHEGLVRRVPGKGTYPISQNQRACYYTARQPSVLWVQDRPVDPKEVSKKAYDWELEHALQNLVHLGEQGFALHFETKSPMPHDPKGFMAWATNLGADVVITRPTLPGGKDLLPLAKSEIPIVFFARQSAYPEFDSITVDYEQDIKRSLELLLGLGHRRIAFVSTDANDHNYDEPTIARWQAYRSVMVEHGLEPYRPVDNYLFGTIQKHVDALLQDEATRPTAIITNGIMYHWPCYHAILQKGLRIGRDISFLAIDDFAEARHLDPPLSVVHQPIGELVNMAIDIARNRCTNRKAEPSRILLQADIILRQSISTPTAR